MLGQGSRQIIAFVAVLLCLLEGAVLGHVAKKDKHVFNIQNYGAVGDGDFNNTNAFNAAIRAASSSGLPYSTVLVPYGEYVTSPIELEDCKNTWIVIQGSVAAGYYPYYWHNATALFKFTSPTNCSVVGENDRSAIYGDRDLELNDSAFPSYKKAALIQFAGMLGGYPQPSVQNLRLYSPPNMAILVTDTVMYQGAEIVNVTIKSGGRADGIVALNASVLIHQTSIDVGGINIAGQTEYGDTSRLFMGISESTLHSGNGMVFNVTDGIAANISGYNVKFKDTNFGISIIGARDGAGEFLQSDFEDLTMTDVGVPITVDNTVCPEDHDGCKKHARGVQINLGLAEMVASQTSGIAGEFHCMATTQCYVGFENVTIIASKPSGKNVCHSHNVKGSEDQSHLPKGCFTKSL